jgi:hypothetical protein
MNLSQRLDKARAEREQAGDSAEPTTFDLRMAKEAPTYDGRDLRTGEPLAWSDRQPSPEDDESNLPAWNPRRANDFVTIDLTVETDATIAGPVLDLRTSEPSTEDVFAMPPWARGEHVFHSDDERA